MLHNNRLPRVYTSIICYGLTNDKCHATIDAAHLPMNLFQDHTYNSWSDPDSSLRFVERSVIPLVEQQKTKYNLPPSSHAALLKWSIYYSHLGGRDHQQAVQERG